MNNNHPIDCLMKSTMEKIKEMIDVNTIIGNPIHTEDGTLILPISKVSFGFASGGSEIPTKFNRESSNGYPFGGGSGAGVSVKPVGFLVVKNSDVRFVSLDHETSYDRMIDAIPQLIETLKSTFKKSKTECTETE